MRQQKSKAIKWLFSSYKMKHSIDNLDQKYAKAIECRAGIKRKLLIAVMKMKTIRVLSYALGWLMCAFVFRS